MTGPVRVGDELPALTVRITRAQLIRYAGASGDFNPIHWNARVAAGVGLPDVIAHGMLTMALAGRIVTDWTGDPAAVLDYAVTFTRPVVVPDDDAGAAVEITARIGAIEPADPTATDPTGTDPTNTDPGGPTVPTDPTAAGDAATPTAPAERRARVDITARHAGQTVLGKARATVRLR